MVFVFSGVFFERVVLIVLGFGVLRMILILVC